MASIAVALESDCPQLRRAALGLSQRLKLPLVAAGSPDFDAFLVVTDNRVRDRIGGAEFNRISEPDAQARVICGPKSRPLLALRARITPPKLSRTPDNRLELRATGPDRMGAVCVDFLGGRMGRRRRELASTRQLIARAIGFTGKPPAVIDATAGLGRDAFVLACMGCNVTAIERSPIIAALLADGLRRAARDPQVGPIVRERLRLIEGDSRELLSKLSPAERPDVIYIDPMFPHRAKSALAKKEMRLCRLVAGDDPDADELLRVALTAARSRVVVKRRLRAPALLRRPAFSYKGRSVRYDVYPCASA